MKTNLQLMKAVLTCRRALRSPGFALPSRFYRLFKP
jgi:hypothetical protein